MLGIKYRVPSKYQSTTTEPNSCGLRSKHGMPTKVRLSFRLDLKMLQLALVTSCSTASDPRAHGTDMTILSAGSRYIYDLYYEKEAISKTLYDWLLKNNYADAMLIAKWKKQGYEKVRNAVVTETKIV